MVLSKSTRLFVVLGGFFVCNALIAEFIGVKIFSLEKVLGIAPFNLQLFDQDGLGFNLTAGVLLWPVVFVMTDIINEYYGRRGVKLLSFLTALLILYAFLMIFFAIRLPPADFWPSSHLLSLSGIEKIAMQEDVSDYNVAFRIVFGQGLWIIAGSIVAFLFGQIIDVLVFRKIKLLTGEGKLWLRATGSTLISQFIDSFVVLFIAFKIGAGWSWTMVIAIGVVNYVYKFIVAVLLTPLIYLMHYLIELYLGDELATRLKLEALDKEK